VVGLYRRKELVNKELKQCKEAVREANTYQCLVDELKLAKTLKTLFDAYHLERHMEKHAGEVEEHEESRKKLDKECAVLEKQMKIKGQEKAQKQKEWAVQDQRAQDIEKEIKKIQRNDSIKVQTTIKSAKVDFEQSTAEAAQAAEKKKEVSRSLKSDEERLSEHEKDLKKEEAANVSKDIQLQGSQVSQYNQLKLKADAETQKAKEAFDKTNREQLADDRELTQMQETHQRLQARLQEREKQVQNDSGEKNSVSEKLQKLQHDKQKLDSDLTDAEVKYTQEKNHREVPSLPSPTDVMRCESMHVCMYVCMILSCLMFLAATRRARQPIRVGVEEHASRYEPQRGRGQEETKRGETQKHVQPRWSSVRARARERPLQGRLPSPLAAAATQHNYCEPFFAALLRSNCEGKF